MFGVKHILRIQALCVMTLVMALFVPVHASGQELRVSLLTCEPFDRIYSLYGHTGLRITDPIRGYDIVANWGIFNMRQKFFALRFTLGLTDYSMDIETWDEFAYRYRYYGCGIYEQVLNLTPEEKQRLLEAVLENYKEENRQYRYNYFFDNCTTRVRDIIEASISGTVSMPPPAKRQSFRSLIHEWNAAHPWYRWGNDFLLGFKADRIATQREAEFLPFNLSHDFAHATIHDTSGTRPLVSDSVWAMPSLYSPGELSTLDTILSPTGVAMAYVVLFIVIVLIETRLHRRLWGLDILMLTLTGVMGLLLFAMLFSQHPTVSLNAQILVFNPLNLLFLRPIYRSLRRGEMSIHLMILEFLLGVGIVLGMAVQHFAEGVMTLALFLLITYMRHNGPKKYGKKQIKQA